VMIFPRTCCNSETGQPHQPNCEQAEQDG
jgi:hypothetical protein